MFDNVYKDLKVLITGATGFKGSWLSYWLSRLGAHVTGYSIDIPTQPSLFEVLSLEKKIKPILGDILDLGKLQAVYDEVNPDIIFHLAAEPIVLKSYESPRQTFMTNAMGTINVLDLAKTRSSIKAVVVVTSDKCYLNSQPAHLLKESDPIGGSDPYSASKACAEIAFHAYFESFFNELPTAVASVRAGNVIGGGDWGLYRLIPDCMRAWSQQQTIEVRHPQFIRPWQYVLDVLFGYLLLGKCLLTDGQKFSGESFNFSAKDSEYTTLDLIQSLQTVWHQGQYSILDQSNQQQKEKESIFLNADKAHQLLHWQSQYDFQGAAEQTAQWYWHYYHDVSTIKQFTEKQFEAYEDS